jgi:hypothetical protein
MRRKSHKRKRFQAEGSLIVEDGARLAVLYDFGARDGKKSKKQKCAEVGELSQSWCGRCNEIGHNALTRK